MAVAERLHEQLRALRQSHGYSQKAVAATCGVSTSLVSAWERAPGQRYAAQPNDETLAKLSDLYDVPLERDPDRNASGQHWKEKRDDEAPPPYPYTPEEVLLGYPTLPDTEIRTGAAWFKRKGYAGDFAQALYPGDPRRQSLLLGAIGSYLKSQGWYPPRGE